MDPKMIHCCEAFKSMLSNYFCKRQVLRGTFGEIWRIQIQIYPKTYVELKYGACYLKNKVSAHRLGLVVQLSWRVAPPLPQTLHGHIFGKSSSPKKENLQEIAYGSKGPGWILCRKVSFFLRLELKYTNLKTVQIKSKNM